MPPADRAHPTLDDPVVAALSESVGGPVGERATRHPWWTPLRVILALTALTFALGMVQKSQWSKLDKQLGLFTTIAVDIQVLGGLILWIMNSWWKFPASVPGAEHPVTMLVALGVMHMGWSRAKKSPTDAGKYRQALIWFGIAGLLVALGILRVAGGMA